MWKWQPKEGVKSKRENAVRMGSRVAIKEGEVVVFSYKQKDNAYEYFLGPDTVTLSTANLPILSGIYGLYYGGNSPFPAEIFFINLGKDNKQPIWIDKCSLFDPRYPDFPIPARIKGTMIYNIEDYKGFIKLHRLIDFNEERFEEQVSSAVFSIVKEAVMSIPTKYGIPALHIGNKLTETNQQLTRQLGEELKRDFGVNLIRIDISDVLLDKESDGYKALKSITSDLQAKTYKAQADVSIQNLMDQQQINSMNLEESMRIQREELQRAQKLQTETTFIGAHALNQQTDVMKTAATSLGEMGQVDAGGGVGMNPIGLMSGMMMGGAIGNQMASMMNTMGQGMNQQMNQAMTAPPPPPVIQYMVLVNGQQSGPFNIEQLAQLKTAGHLSETTYVWKQGMPQWEMVQNVAELAGLLQPVANTPPPPPPGAV